MDEALRYIMDNCIRKNQTKDKTVHNLAMYFLAQRDKPEELIEYLKKEELRKAEGHAIFFEVDYALNVCKQKEKDLRERYQLFVKTGGSKKTSSYDLEEKSLNNQINLMKKAQIILYAILNLHDKAVKLALECRDLQMAKTYADKPADKKSKKKLWMKIAKYLFRYKGKKEKLQQNLNRQRSQQLDRGKSGEGQSASGQKGQEEPVDVSNALENLKDSILKIGNNNIIIIYR